MRRGFTLTDLLGVLLIAGLLALLIWMLLPHRNNRAPAWRVKCGSNLRQIGQAMRQYAIDHEGQFPRTRFDPEDPTPRFFTGVEAHDPFADDGPEPNDITAALWLVLREADLVPEVFICPQDDRAQPLRYADFGIQGKREFSNFPGRRYLSYSLANPYPSAQAAAAGWQWTNQLPSTFALAADINPGSPALLTTSPDSTRDELREVNSPNHHAEGQNVLYGDGSVRFVQTPFEGPQKDNIYTAGGYETLNAQSPTGGVAIVSPPLTKLDSVLLPTADAPLGPGTSSPTRTFWLYIALPGLVTGVIALGIVILIATRSRRRRLERGELPEVPPSDAHHP